MYILIDYLFHVVPSVICGVYLIYRLYLLRILVLEKVQFLLSLNVTSLLICLEYLWLFLQAFALATFWLTCALIQPDDL